MAAAQRAKRASSTPYTLFPYRKDMSVLRVSIQYKVADRNKLMKKKYAGIYKIVVRAEGAAHTYVGKSVDMIQRYHQHQHALRAGRHANHKLQDLYDKYGAGSMEFQIIEVVTPSSDEDDTLFSLERREIYWTKALGADINIMNTRLSPSDVEDIKSSLSRGESMVEVAQRFSISTKYLREILRGRRWIG